MAKKVKINLTPTPHNAAKKGQIAKRVLMPGDPKRATWIAETFLKDYKLVSDVRGIKCYTGKYKNQTISVMAHGMGIPSIAIYATELYQFYDVKTIYRIGSAGVYKKSKLTVGDVISVSEAWSDIPIENWIGVKYDKKNIFNPTKSSLDLIVKTAKENKIDINVRRVASDNFFYNVLSGEAKYKANKTYIYEMESFGLFALAKKYHKHAACLLTVSDVIDGNLAMSAHERQTKFYNMVKLALEAIIKEK